MSFERILVIGYSGYMGPWVLEALRIQFPQALIYGAARQVTGTAAQDVKVDGSYALDLRYPEQIRKVIAATLPDAVIHLASQRMSDLEELLAVNVLGFDRLLAHLKTYVPKARIVVIGSAAELGRAGGQDIPLNEKSVCEPVDSYGITKLAQSGIAQLHALRGYDVIRLRIFNLIGPGLPESLLPGRCALLLRGALGCSVPIRLDFGPLGTRRDYVDVRDVARSVALALAKGRSAALYHIGSGTSRSGHELVDSLITESGLTQISIQSREACHATLVPSQIADIRFAHADIGWRPAIQWRTSVRDLWASAHPG